MTLTRYGAIPQMLLLAGTLTGSEAAPRSAAGQWTADLPAGDGESVRLVVDLGRVGSRWVGEFDLLETRVQDYPVEVSLEGSVVRLHFTALGMNFSGMLSEEGRVLAGAGDTEGEREPIVFERAADEPRFSEGFLALESGPDETSRLQALAVDGAELRTRFNADRDRTRLLLLLSPT